MKRTISEIKNVPYYGKSFPFIPWSLKSKLKVSLVFAKHLYKELGLFRFIGFWLAVPFRMIPSNMKYREGLKIMRDSFGGMAKEEWALLLIIYDIIKKKHGEERAYSFSKSAIQDASLFMMNDFYQADMLSEFEDPFEAFWEYHKAMFKDDPNYPNEFIEEKNRKIMIVHKCQNCEIAKKSIPGLSPLGCDHDITGYRAIGKKVKMEFRRPQTLAKDEKPCRFMFFREGKAPEDLETR